MTLVGVVFMLVSLSFVWGLAFWCYRKVLSGAPEGKRSMPPE